MDSKNTCPFKKEDSLLERCPVFSNYEVEAKKIMDSLPELLDQQTLDVVNKTAAAVVANIETITSQFYPYMFEKFPVTLNYFNKSHQISKCPETGQVASQPFALAHAIVRYVGHLNDPVGLKAAIELAAQKHCALQVRAEHYPIVYECFMWAVGQVLGGAVTPEVADAWSKVVLYIARAFIQREVEIYKEAQNSDFGWFGWKEFVCTDKRRDTDLIYTFVFATKDNMPLPKVGPGKYITLRIKNIPGAPAEYTSRHYSVSAIDRNKYSISVLIETGKGAPGGLFSNYLRNNMKCGDSVDISMPFGEMGLDGINYSTKPVVFIVGGIGCTVAASLLLDLVENRDFQRAYFIHCVHDGASHAYRNRISRLAQNNQDKIKYLRVYSHPREVDTLGIDFDIEGRFSFQTLLDFVGQTDLINSSYVLCGPEGLVVETISHLTKNGVNKTAIQFECFGPLSKKLELYSQQ